MVSTDSITDSRPELCPAAGAGQLKAAKTKLRTSGAKKRYRPFIVVFPLRSNQRIPGIVGVVGASQRRKPPGGPAGYCRRERCHTRYRSIRAEIHGSGPGGPGR